MKAGHQREVLQPETSTMRSIAASRWGNEKLGQHQVIPKLSWTNPGSPFGLAS